MFRYLHTIWLLRHISERSLADVIRAVSLGSRGTHPCTGRSHVEAGLEIYCVIGATSAVEVDMLTYGQRNRIGWIFRNEYRAQC